MPQLDHVTYFSQSFWLTLFFLAFYVILVKSLLPRVSTILKLRKKLTEPKIQENVSSSAQQTPSVYDHILMNAFQQSKDLIAKTSESSQKWTSNTARSVHLQNLSSSQESYVDAVGQLLAKKHILLSLLEESK